MHYILYLVLPVITHLLEASVVGGQVSGALGVISPGVVVTGYQLPVSCDITLAVRSS